MARQQHEQGRDPLDRRALEVADARHRARRSRRWRSPPWRGRWHRTCDMPAQPKAIAQASGEQDVDDGDLGHDLGGLGQELARPGGEVDHEQLQAADAQIGQDQDREGDQAEAAQPDQQEAPEQDAARRLVEADIDRGAGGAQAGDGLEDRVGEAQRLLGEQERQRAEQAGADPGQDDGEHALAQVDAQRLAGEAQRQGDAGEQRDRGGGDEAEASGCRRPHRPAPGSASPRPGR